MNSEEIKLPMALLLFFGMSYLTAILEVVVSFRVDTKRWPPLYDLLHENLPHVPWAFEVSEMFILALIATLLALLVVHKHRAVILRRACALYAIVFLFRNISLCLTTLPVPSIHLHPECTTKDFKNDLFSILKEATRVFLGAGLSINNVITCGDYMFSGHAAVSTLLAFTIREYTAEHMWGIHALCWIANGIGAAGVVLAREHYSVDVVIGFYVAAGAFRYYHEEAAMPHRPQLDPYAILWSPIKYIFETDKKIENHLDDPFSGWMRRR